MTPQLLFGAVQSIGGSFAVGAVNSALAGYPSTNNATDTIVLYMSDKTRFEYGYASAMSVVLMLLMLLFWRVVNRALRSFDSK